MTDPRDDEHGYEEDDFDDRDPYERQADEEAEDAERKLDAAKVGDYHIEGFPWSGR